MAVPTAPPRSRRHGEGSVRRGRWAVAREAVTRPTLDVAAFPGSNLGPTTGERETTPSPARSRRGSETPVATGHGGAPRRHAPRETSGVARGGPERPPNGEDAPQGRWSAEVVPRATHLLLGGEWLARLRRETLAGLRGSVVEIGFGSGLNLGCYPPEVDVVLAVEPSSVATRLAASRIRAANLRVEHVGGDAQRLPIATASVDAAVSTFTLCTVPDPRRALDELRRVLRPGGSLRFLEHGLSPRDAVARWQRRLTPVQRRLAAGCHLDRPIDQLVEEAGFVLDERRRDDLGGPALLRPFGHLYLGAAHRADAPSRGGGLPAAPAGAHR